MAECPREQDVLDALAAGRWPSRVDAGLAAHAARCEVCRDLALVAAAIASEREAAWPQAQVPSAAHVWWRAQMRARRDAARAAARPITWAQGLAGASAAGLLAAGAGYALRAAWWPGLPAFGDALPDLSSLAALPDPGAALNALRAAAGGLAAAVAALPHVELVAAACLVLLVMPAAALYFVLAE